MPHSCHNQGACTLQVLLEPSSSAKQHVAQLVAQLSQDHTDLTLTEAAMALSGYCSVSGLHCEHVFAAGAVGKLLQLIEHAGSPQVSRGDWYITEGAQILQPWQDIAWATWGQVAHATTGLCDSIRKVMLTMVTL